MNIFGFNAQRQYGFEQGFENRKIDWDKHCLQPDSISCISRKR